MVNKTVEKLNKIDILVNNAGIVRTTRFPNINKEEWDEVLDVNLNGPFLCSKYVVE